MGKQKGYRYFNENNDLLRGYEWQPKDQLNANALLKYSKNKTTIFYKASFLNEEINYKNNKINVKSFPGGEKTYYADDRDYFTKRWLHQFNIQTNFGNVRYAGDFSYQTQNRNYEDFIYDVPARKEVSRKDKYTYYDTKVYYSRGTFSNFLNKENFNFQIGYELDQTNGFASPETLGNNNGKDLRKKIFSYANFVSAEWQVAPKFSLRPGFRLALSDKFSEQYNFSLTGKWDVTQNSYLRLIVGSANRFPKYEELYTYFVDNNHDLRGNENLKPETGYSGGLFYDFQSKEDGRSLSFNASAMYLEVKNRIEAATINFAPLQLKYININSYKSYLFSGGFQYRKNNLLFNSGVSLMGISKALNGPRGEKSPDDFYFYPEINASASYKAEFGTLFALYYKYSGISRQTVMEEDIQGNATFRIGKIGDYSMMNFSVSQPFLSNHIELTLGIKNIFNVTDLLNTTLAGSAHSAASSSQNYFYGRSYFARLIYNF